jgi:hypothetical protein
MSWMFVCVEAFRCGNVRGLVRKIVYGEAWREIVEALEGDTNKCCTCYFYVLDLCILRSPPSPILPSLLVHIYENNPPSHLNSIRTFHMVEAASRHL